MKQNVVMLAWAKTVERAAKEYEDQQLHYAAQYFIDAAETDNAGGQDGVVVPREPTKAMLNAWYSKARLRATPEECYRAMIAAAETDNAGGQVSRANTEQGSGTTVSPVPPAPDELVNSLAGPHEWGYRDPVSGEFIVDDAPFNAADRIEALLTEIEHYKEGCHQLGELCIASDTQHEADQRRIAELEEQVSVYVALANAHSERAEKAEAALKGKT